MGAFFAVVIILGVLAGVVLTQIFARQQLDLLVPCSRADAIAVIQKYFGPIWTSVPGNGQLNYRPKLRVHAPTISISVDGTAEGCHVSAWVSAGTTKYGLMYHAGLMARKKRGIAKRLGALVATPAGR